MQKVEGEPPYFLLQLSNIPANLNTKKILDFFKAVNTRVGKIKTAGGHAYVPMMLGDIQVRILEVICPLMDCVELRKQKDGDHRRYGDRCCRYGREKT